jgi:NAD(P)H-dependent flavin oxidoreductase YrpB (nitropropane dioxygenase family)
VIIQGGMGVAVSSWRLARAVSLVGELGVVSGTALEVVMTRRLQDGDEGGHVRRALAHFPVPRLAEWVLERYFRPPATRRRGPYRLVPKLTVRPTPMQTRLATIANFVEVWLAKEGHDGVVGANFLEKVQMATPAAVLGAMLADVDYVLMGAGVPRATARLLDDFAAGRPGRVAVDVAGADRPLDLEIDPADVLGAPARALRRPAFLAIVSSHVLAGYLTRDPAIRPDGFVVEGPGAGGHNAPPRGTLALDERGEPVYGPRDLPDSTKFSALGLPFWLAGGYGSPGRLRAARSTGAAGAQVGTVFALSHESGIASDLKGQLRDRLARDDLTVRTDPRASPTSFPFKVAELPGTIGDHEVYQQRQRLCDIGYLRTPYRREDGSIGYRCAAEPVADYVRKGGDTEDTVGRACLCNGLTATVGLGQHRHSDYLEDALVTFGTDVAGARALAAHHPQGWSAAQAVEWLLSPVPAEETSRR